MPVLRVKVVHQRVPYVDLTFCDGLQTCCHAQRRRLAAAGRSEQCDELSLPAFKVEILYSVVIQLGTFFLFAIVIITLVKMFYG